MFLFDWFWSLLSSLGLYNKSGKLVFLGLDNAGKTTLLRLLTTGQVSVHAPTQYPHSEDFNVGNVSFKGFDLGGHTSARAVWRSYLAKVNGIVFVIDSSDQKRLPEARDELSAILRSDEVSHVPICIIGNKVDKKDALSEQQLKQFLDIGTECTGKNGKAVKGRPIEVFMCSMVKRFGHQDAMQWIAAYLDVVDVKK